MAMKNSILQRAWVTPIVATTFLAVAVTGILLGFRIKGGGIVNLHEWLGYTFALFSSMHLVINWRCFCELFRCRAAVWATIAALIISAAVFQAGESRVKRARPNPLVQVLDANRNGVIDPDELANASALLQQLDADKDGSISPQEQLTGSKQKRKH